MLHESIIGWGQGRQACVWRACVVCVACVCLSGSHVCAWRSTCAARRCDYLLHARRSGSANCAFSCMLAWLQIVPQTAALFKQHAAAAAAAERSGSGSRGCFIWWYVRRGSQNPHPELTEHLLHRSWVRLGGNIRTQDCKAALSFLAEVSEMLPLI